MKIRQIQLSKFKRFSDLTVTDIPAGAKLVVLAGPNGCGKSSLFDAMAVRYQQNSGYGWSGDHAYYSKSAGDAQGVEQRVQIQLHGGGPISRGAMYFRSAYRNDPEFALGQLQRMGDPLTEIRLRRMIEQDATVSLNYQRLAGRALEALFLGGSDQKTVPEVRNELIGPIRAALKRIFSDLTLDGMGDPLDRGTFSFSKGIVSGYDYKNLSGGEKAAFDLLLDLAVKRASYPEGIFCIDEPETHTNTRLQGALLQELLDLVPPAGQLWIATHSIGMMRKAQEIYKTSPGNVAFLDFEGYDFDQAVILKPVTPNREFWERVLKVALDDLASLVAPKEVVICEGHPGGLSTGKNAEHDARCYNAIFSLEYPDVKFISAGNAHDVASDRLGLLTALPQIASISVRRLIDRDDHSPTDCADLANRGIETLGRRHIESYLYDDEILTALCVSLGQSAAVVDVLADKATAIAGLASRGKPNDDIKSAAGEIFMKLRQRLNITAMGNDQMAFARNMLVPLVRPGTNTYAALKKDIFKV